MTAAFDPLQELFVAQQDRPAKVRDVNLRTLEPYQRALMVIDGTVTKFLEAYTMESVDIVPLGQESRHLDSDHPWLEVPAGERVVGRQVVLRGRHSHRFHAYAVSLTVPTRLREDVRNQLKGHGEGLGRVLRKCRIDTYREVLWYGREEAETIPGHFPEPLRDGCLTRTYRILAEQRPIMLINERFPLRPHGSTNFA